MDKHIKNRLYNRSFCYHYLEFNIYLYKTAGSEFFCVADFLCSVFNRIGRSYIARTAQQEQNLSER